MASKKDEKAPRLAGTGPDASRRARMEKVGVDACRFFYPPTREVSIDSARFAGEQEEVARRK
jgi:hypothetical protein